MKSATYSVAVVENRDGTDMQAVLAEAARRWRLGGADVVGVLALAPPPEGDKCNANTLQDIVSGQSYSIRFDRAPAGAMCRLDASGLDDACARLLPQIPGCDLVMLSKFGKTEADGDGLWAAIEAAFLAGKPILTTVSPTFAGAFRGRLPDAEWLQADSIALDRWWRAVKPAAGSSISVQAEEPGRRPLSARDRRQ